MSISVVASRSRRRAVLAGTSVVAVAAVIGFFESNVVEMSPVAAAPSVMQPHVTAENAGTARVSGSAVGEPVSYRLADEQDDSDQLQNQLNTQQQLNQQSIQQSEQEAQEQNDAAEQQAERDEQQAQMDEQQADQ